MWIPQVPFLFLNEFFHTTTPLQNAALSIIFDWLCDILKIVHRLSLSSRLCTDVVPINYLSLHGKNC